MCETYEIEIIENYDLIKQYQHATRDEICDLPGVIRRELCEQIKEMQMELDWNRINADRYSNKPNSDSPGIRPSNPKIPPQPRPYRSWYEDWIFNFTQTRKAEYEPKSAKVSFLLECTYQPDWVSAINPNVAFDAKGVIGSNDVARRYKAVRDQTDLNIIFVLQQRNIELPYQKKRVDGSRQTLEEWCKKNGFYHTYGDKLDEFYASDLYKKILDETPMPLAA